MAFRSAIGGIVGVLAVCLGLWSDCQLLAADPPSNEKAPAKNGGAEAKSDELLPKPEATNGATSPPANNDLSLSAAPNPSMGCEGPCRPGLEGLFCGECFCGPPGRFWLRGDYMLWWTNGTHLPALVTTSPITTPQNQAGVLGLPTTTILYGDQTVNMQSRSGGRVTLGFWLNCGQTWGIEADYFDLGGNSSNFTATSTATGDPIIARPFFDVNPQTGLPRQAAELVSYPNLVQGTISVSDWDYFQSAGVHLRHPLCCGELCGGTCGGGNSCRPQQCGPRCCRVDLIVGYRYYRFNDNVLIHEQISGLQGSPFVGTTFDVIDSFRAQNDFHGAEIGLIAQTYRGPWSFEFMVKMALGNNHEAVAINGSTLVSQQGRSILYAGGLYALDSNIGAYSRDEFVVIPQLGFEVGYQVTCNLRAYLGYNFLYWAPMMRAADQIDLNVDSARIPGRATGRTPILPFPAFDWHCSSLWAQGINAGVEFRY